MSSVGICPKCREYALATYDETMSAMTGCLSCLRAERDALQAERTARWNEASIATERFAREHSIRIDLGLERDALKARAESAEKLSAALLAGCACSGCDGPALCDEDGCCVTCGEDIPGPQGYVHRTLAKAESAALRAKLEQAREALEKIKGSPTDFMHGEDCPRQMTCDAREGERCTDHEDEGCPECDCSTGVVHDARLIALAALAALSEEAGK